MSAGNGYRDDLVAAQQRIAELERRVASSLGTSAVAARLAALVRERAAVVAATKPRSVWRMLVWIFVVFFGVAIAFAHDGAWVFAGLAVAAPFGVGVVGQRISNANVKAAIQQLALIDQEIAAIEQGTAARLLAEAAPEGPHAREQT